MFKFCLTKVKSIIQDQLSPFVLALFFPLFGQDLFLQCLVWSFGVTELELC